MKPYLQAKPQLRGPQGLRNWYAQLPDATLIDQASTAILPIESLMRPRPRPAKPATPVAPETSRRVWAASPLMASLLFLLSKKSYCQNTGRAAGPALSGPWLRHLLGAVALLPLANLAA